MLKTYELIDQTNSVFCWFVVCSAILVLKMLAMSTLTSIQRFRSQVDYDFIFPQISKFLFVLFCLRKINILMIWLFVGVFILKADKVGSMKKTKIIIPIS